MPEDLYSYEDDSKRVAHLKVERTKGLFTTVKVRISDEMPLTRIVFWFHVTSCSNMYMSEVKWFLPHYLWRLLGPLVCMEVAVTQKDLLFSIDCIA